MPLVNMNDMLRKAQKEIFAIGNFDVFNYEMLRAVVRACEKKQSPLIVAYGEAFKELCGIKDFVAMVVAMAQPTGLPVALHLDHANNLDIIKEALDAGFTSVMMDASDKELDENIAISRKVVELCAPYKASAEAELGHVGGLEGQYEASDYETSEDSFTKVDEAVRFVKETEVDALAVAIGTVHGVMRSEPDLNLKRLHELKEAIGVPLVLHGGSGLSDDDLRNCVQGGICKMNIFTDLTIAAIEQMEQDAGSKLAYMDRCMRMSEAMQKVAEDRIDVLGSAKKA